MACWACSIAVAFVSMLSEEGSPGMARNLADCRGAERAAFFEAARWFTRLFAPIANGRRAMMRLDGGVQRHQRLRARP